MRRFRRRGSVMVLFTLMLPSLLIPLVGLAIDASICRLMQTKLQAAVDGAAIGAGRLLGTTADPETVAREFIDANFRTDDSAGTWGSFNLQKTDVHYTPGVTKRIDINASADVPLLFMRILGKTKATVAAGGSSTRTDTRVVFVMDRSNSMTGSTGGGHTAIEDAKDDAAGFVQKFTSGADELGMVVFDGTAFVAYPQSNPNWDSTTTSTSRGGPDMGFNDPADTNNMVNEIGTIVAGGQTNTSEALWLAYIELQKAHLKDLARDGFDYRMNSIVLLTDGIPQAASVFANDNSDPDTSTTPPTYPWNSLKTTSTCDNKITTANPNPPKIRFAAGVARPFSGNSFDKAFQMATQNTTLTSLWWLSHAGMNRDTSSAVLGYALVPANISGCGSLQGSFGSTTSTIQDLSRIPKRDAWGNSMEGTLYKTWSQVVDINGAAATNPLNTTITLSPTSSVTSGDNWALAFWNAADSAASRIRTDVNRPNRSPADTQDMRVTIHVIGYAGNGNLDKGLCRRIANDSGIVDSTEPIGKFVLATNRTELQNGFTTIFQTILRLAK